MHGTHLVAMHTTDQDGALARLRSLGDHHRHIPVLSGGHLDALEIQEVLLPGLQVVDVERADDFLPLDHIAGIDRSLRAPDAASAEDAAVSWAFAGQRRREGSRRADRGNRCDHEVAAIEAFFRFVRHDGVLCHCERQRSQNGTHIGN